MTTTIASILDTIKGYAPDADLGVVMTAYLLAARAHAGQTRKSGEAYLHHPLEVAEILADLRMDVDTIATALLHDALEDNPLSKEEMTAEVGPVITEIVDGVTKIGKLKYRSKDEYQAENFRKMMLAMSRDLRVILVKLADRLHNMRTLDGHKPEKRKQISAETLDVYAPIANRLGLTAIKGELEDLCLHHMEPDAHAEIMAHLDATAVDREAFIGRVQDALRDLLHEAGVEGKVKGRVKTPASIWRKMVSQRKRVGEVPDILAFRVVVPDVNACYSLLGVIHGAWEPVPGRIKDYVARPKPNGYRSLHTTVIGPEGKLVEVQIRTADMDRVSEEGIAAHWKYKEGHLDLPAGDLIEIARLREVFDAVADAPDAVDFMERTKAAFYADEVLVFTPAGEVKKFPVGATPVDFAYAIHSDVGDHCTGAKVDGRMVPLDHVLKSGETLEILTSPHQCPRRDWLRFARTGRALSRIRRFLRQQEEDQAVRIGTRLLETELGRFDWSLSRAHKEGRFEGYLRDRSIKDANPIYVELAKGNVAVEDVARAVLPEGVWVSRVEQAQKNRLAGLLRWNKPKARSPVLIGGEDDVLVQYAGCCNPLPGEAVEGFITRGRGITVHRADCRTLAETEADRRVPVAWDLAVGARHSNALHIFCHNRPGILASITKVCEVVGVNIERAEAEAIEGGAGSARVTLQLGVKDLEELTRVIRNVEKIDGVEAVARA